MNIKPSPLFSSPSAYTLFFLRISLYNLLTRVLCHRFYPRPNSTEAPLELVHKQCDGNNRTRVVFPAWKYEGILLYYFGFNNKWPHSYSPKHQTLYVLWRLHVFSAFFVLLPTIYHLSGSHVLIRLLYKYSGSKSPTWNQNNTSWKQNNKLFCLFYSSLRAIA